MDKALETYLSLCTEVYDLSKPNPPEDAYAFYRDYTIKANGPILEPMCGTGRFLLPLLAEGFDVHGFDASDHMLEALHVKAEAKNLEPTIWKGFVEDLKRPEKYTDYVNRINNALDHVLDPTLADAGPILMVSHGFVYGVIQDILGLPIMDIPNAEPVYLLAPENPAHPWRVYPLRQDGP